MSLAPDDPRHGTYNGYNNHGCRCEACRVAMTDYHRARGTGGYKRVPCECGQPKRPEAARCRACEHAAREAPHGTEARARRCRCDVCRAGATAAKRRRREQSRQPCVHGCGTLVVTINRDYPDKPLECRSCAARRVVEQINARRRAAA